MTIKKFFEAYPMGKLRIYLEPFSCEWDYDAPHLYKDFKRPLEAGISDVGEDWLFQTYGNCEVGHIEVKSEMLHVWMDILVNKPVQPSEVMLAHSAGTESSVFAADRRFFKKEALLINRSCLQSVLAEILKCHSNGIVLKKESDTLSCCCSERELSFYCFERDEDFSQDQMLSLLEEHLDVVIESVTATTDERGRPDEFYFVLGRTWTGDSPKQMQERTNVNRSVACWRKEGECIEYVTFASLKAGDIFFINGISHLAAEDAQQGSGSDFFGSLIHDTQGNFFFPGNLDSVFPPEEKPKATKYALTCVNNDSGLCSIDIFDTIEIALSHMATDVNATYEETLGCSDEEDDVRKDICGTSASVDVNDDISYVWEITPVKV